MSRIKVSIRKTTTREHLADHVVAVRDLALVRKTFNTWACEDRGRLLGRVLATRRLRGAFNQWHSKRARLDDLEGGFRSAKSPLTRQPRLQSSWPRPTPSISTRPSPAGGMCWAKSATLHSRPTSSLKRGLSKACLANGKVQPPSSPTTWSQPTRRTHSSPSACRSRCGVSRLPTSVKLRLSRRSAKPT